MDLYADLFLRLGLRPPGAHRLIEDLTEASTRTREIIAESRELIASSDALLHSGAPPASSEAIVHARKDDGEGT